MIIELSMSMSSTKSICVFEYCALQMQNADILITALPSSHSHDLKWQSSVPSRSPSQQQFAKLW